MKKRMILLWNWNDKFERGICIKAICFILVLIIGTTYVVFSVETEILHEAMANKICLENNAIINTCTGSILSTEYGCGWVGSGFYPFTDITIEKVSCKKIETISKNKITIELVN